ncbi:MAG: N-acetylglutaminylglutamine amidotransferase, partial [Thiobacillus sp.]|nr:N-acetylglutaminylglutamine amidotransferase [Thiobacillus sp.]
MCGIAGEFRFDYKAPEPDIMARMLAKLARRGPDAEGQHADGAVRLGHRRLAIIDLSARSQQPMVDAASGTALVFNGTIYNYPELRTELIGRGHVFHSDGDTEVILRAFLEWGEACVERLHGMFAFAIWNRETLFLARDRLGIKPLYYSENPGCFRFAST